jgi:hypothetical protein
MMSSWPVEGDSTSRESYVLAVRGVYALDPAGLGAVVIELCLQSRHPLAGLLELLAGALKPQLEAGDPLFQLHRLRHVDLLRSGAMGGSAETTDTGQCGMSVKKVSVVVTSNNSRASRAC